MKFHQIFYILYIAGCPPLSLSLLMWSGYFLPQSWLNLCVSLFVEKLVFIFVLLCLSKSLSIKFKLSSEHNWRMPQIDSDPSSTIRSSNIEKQYQALIVLIPVSIAAIILLLFYFFYLHRGAGLRARRASTENNNDISNVGLIIN